MRYKLLINFFIILFVTTYFIHLYQAQSVIDPNAYNLTALCAQSISSAADDQSLNNCIPMNTLVLSLPSFFDKSTNDPTEMLNVLSQLIKNTCTLTPCSIDTVQAVLQSLKSQCSQELELKNIIITAVFELFNYYSLVRDIICLRDNGNQYDSYCVLETLINIGQALNSTSSSASNNVARRSPKNVIARRCLERTNIDIDTPSIDTNDPAIITTQISFSSVTNVPMPTTSNIVEHSKVTSISASTTISATTSSAVSSSSTPIPTPQNTSPQSTSNVTCPADMSLVPVMTPLLNLSSQAIFTKILLYTKNNPTAFDCTPFSPIISMAPGFFSQKCNPQFLDQNIPSSISGATSILTHVKVHELLGIGIGCLSLWLSSCMI
ncbi:12187_t:CDS:2 [Dentiscutata erythropus]|uniref:12187_t:CDS:1 n=1 Tax=Dentiscutata erythropus TaxID=1348616 RepID=A0A9N8VWD4_9GLOM|nr:12187_t:CDS:2 [Dentiscutata erythropus]